ncbi:MAG: hypothetical protein OXU79_09800 [Gemmatimonadota bacterium]|nr:hypothetical protein [Gemmatimonadota bacterium]
MRRFLICVILCAVAWGAQHDFPHSVQPAVYVGLMLVVPLTLAGTLAGSAIPLHAIPLALGFLAGGFGIRHTEAFAATAPLSELAQVWVGLYLGASFSYHRFFSKKLGVSAIISIGATLIPAFPAFFLLLGFPVVQAVRLGLLAGMSGPMITLISQPDRREGLSFSILVTSLGLSLWFLADLFVSTPGLYRAVPSAIMWAVGVELIARMTHTVRTGVGGQVLFGAIVATLFVCARTMHISPLFLSLVTGVGVSARSARSGIALRGMAPLSVPLSYVVLTYFAAGLDLDGLLELSALHWKTLVIYVAVMLVGKTAGGLSARRCAGLFVRDWSQLLPQGFFVFALLHEAFSPAMEPAVRSGLTAGVVLLCGIAIPALTAPILYLYERMDRSRIQAAPRSVGTGE